MAWRNDPHFTIITIGEGASATFKIIQNAGAPSSGTSGTGAGKTGPGSLCVDTTNAKLYINTNTKASPLWTVVGAQTT